MSYYNRLAKFPKKSHFKYQELSYDDVMKKFSDSSDDPEDLQFNVAAPDESQELTMIDGLKVVTDNINLKPFYDFDIHEYEKEFYIIEKEDLEKIIKIINKEISDYYESMKDKTVSMFLKIKENKPLDEDDQYTLGKIYGFMLSRNGEWQGDRYSNCKIKDDGSYAVTNSGIYEHLIFNLVSIYQRFNWEEDYLIYSGW